MVGGEVVVGFKAGKVREVFREKNVEYVRFRVFPSRVVGRQIGYNYGGILTGVEKSF